jgi:hypothetical protein
MIGSGWNPLESRKLHARPHEKFRKGVFLRETENILPLYGREMLGRKDVV